VVIRTRQQIVRLHQMWVTSSLTEQLEPTAWILCVLVFQFENKTQIILPSDFKFISATKHHLEGPTAAYEIAVSPSVSPITLTTVNTTLLAPPDSRLTLRKSLLTPRHAAGQ